jgi:hypothetical protein
LGGTLSQEQRDLAACGSAASRRDVLQVFQKHALLRDEFDEPVAVFAGIARAAEELLEIVMRRYERASTLLASNVL